MGTFSLLLLRFGWNESLLLDMPLLLSSVSRVHTRGHRRLRRRTLRRVWRGLYGVNPVSHRSYQAFPESHPRSLAAPKEDVAEIVERPSQSAPRTPPPYRASPESPPEVVAAPKEDVAGIVERSSRSATRTPPLLSVFPSLTRGHRGGRFLLIKAIQFTAYGMLLKSRQVFPHPRQRKNHQNTSSLHHSSDACTSRQCDHVDYDPPETSFRRFPL